MGMLMVTLLGCKNVVSPSNQLLAVQIINHTGNCIPLGSIPFTRTLCLSKMFMVTHADYLVVWTENVW